MYLQLSLHLSDEVSEYLTGTVTDVGASSEEIGSTNNSRLTQRLVVGSQPLHDHRHKVLVGLLQVNMCVNEGERQHSQVRKEPYYLGLSAM